MRSRVPTGWIFRCRHVLLLCAVISSGRTADIQVQFSQRSEPPALISSSLVLVNTGAVVSTVSAPMSTGSYRFVHWTFNGVRQQDPLGRGINPVRFTITEPVEAVAQFVLATEDADADGIPDWFEWHFYGSLQYGPLSDTDQDGLTLEQEFQRDSHPNVRDAVADGGVSRRSSTATLIIQATNIVTWQLLSSPPGVVDTNLPVAIGSVQLLPDVYSNYFGYRFAQWEVNGVRVADALGRSVGNLGVSIASNTTAVAIFLSSTASALNDDVPDWFKLQFYGSTAVPADSDTDGDGFTLLDEYNRDTHPNLRDTIADGGLSRRASESVGFRHPGYVFYTENSSPPGFVARELILATNTVHLLPDVRTNGNATGYAFAEWRVNGLRVADALGRSVGNLPVLVSTDTTATAFFVPSGQQTLADGIPDWFKWQFYGTTNITSDSDTDGDGFNLEEEYRRDYHPNLHDTIRDGGISGRASELTYVFVPYYYRIESNPPELIPTVTDYVPYGTRIQTTNAPARSGEYIFGHWRVNGLRQADADGYPLNPVSFNVHSNSIATAIYYLATADTNSNGLPDWWEDYYFGGPTSADPSADTDGDGLNNLNEYIAGTHPRSARSRFTIADLRLTPEGWEITFSAVSGKFYRVEYNSDLQLTNGWQILLDTFQATNDLIQVVDPTATNVPARFYRLRVFP